MKSWEKIVAYAMWLLAKGKRLGAGIIEWMFGILMAVIVGFKVVVPTIQDVVANMSGTEATIAGLVGTIITLVVLYLAADPLLNRRSS